MTLRAGRVPRADVGQLSGAVDGPELPAGRQRVRGVPRDQRHRQRHRHLAGGAGAAVQAVQSDRQRPGAQVRGHGPRPGDGEAPRRAARRRGGGGERRRRGLAASRSGCRSARRRTRRVTSAKAPAAPASTALAGARTALVVEDDFKSAELIRVQLEAEGFTVLHAASAEAALALAVQQPLSLITLDIMLPNMDGWEFLSRLKQMPDAAAHPGRDHLDRRGSQQGLRARRRGGHAEADLPAGAVRVARRSRAVSRRAGPARSRSWWSTTIPRRWS